MSIGTGQCARHLRDLADHASHVASGAMLDEASQEVAATLTTRPVDRKVNSVRAADPTDPTLIEAVYA